MTDQLRLHLERTSTAPATAVVTAFAESIRQNHVGVLAIFAYGSALRESSPDDTLIDFYVLTENWRGVSKNVLSAAMAKLVPPNVYYAEFKQENKTYRAKYAALTLECFGKKMGGEVANPYFWARFTQPTQLVWHRDEKAREIALQCLMQAACTATANAKALAPRGGAREQWTTLFQQTYRTELRPEASNRAAQIVAANAAHYELLSAQATPTDVSAMGWRARARFGKLLSILRLLKAALTFQGGADYAAWKIKRHSGVEIEVKPWHRRHPILASVALLPLLLKRGGLK